ncbi:2Fe-2S iron-sulfur cluster-binding protein, partial [Candidatus Hydrogenedentota bacterium]
MVNLIINDKQVTAEEGTSVLEAARSAGINIPTLCHHESLQPYGSCRICIVEATDHRGRTKVATSCTLPVSEGMKIVTSSNKIMRIRRMLMELLLARCPESEKLIKLAAEFGVTKTRFGKPPHQASTIVGEEACILCGMCVRLCDDILKVGALGFEGRGGKRCVTTPFGESAEACMTCGACSFICPTGAIEQNRIFDRKPVQIPAEFEENLATRRPVYIPFPQAVPRVPVIDKDNCMNFRTGGCKVCEDNCEAEAIDHAQEDVIDEVDVGAIVVATGFDL